MMTEAISKGDAAVRDPWLTVSVIATAVLSIILIGSLYISYGNGVVVVFRGIAIALTFTSALCFVWMLTRISSDGAGKLFGALTTTVYAALVAYLLTLENPLLPDWAKFGTMSDVIEYFELATADQRIFLVLRAVGIGAFGLCFGFILWRLKLQCSSYLKLDVSRHGRLVSWGIGILFVWAAHAGSFDIFYRYIFNVCFDISTSELNVL